MPVALEVGARLIVLVDEQDAERVARYRWHDCGGYVARSYREGGEPKTQYLHHFILGTAAKTDHRNRDRRDNTRKNLRPATASQNAANQERVNGKVLSHYKGACFDARCGLWQARIGFNGKRVSLGYFEKEEEAAGAYNKAAQRLFGAYARLNSI